MHIPNICTQNIFKQISIKPSLIMKPLACTNSSFHTLTYTKKWSMLSNINVHKMCQKVCCNPIHISLWVWDLAIQEKYNSVKKHLSLKQWCKPPFNCLRDKQKWRLTNDWSCQVGIANLDYSFYKRLNFVQKKQFLYTWSNEVANSFNYTENNI